MTATDRQPDRQFDRQLQPRVAMLSRWPRRVSTCGSLEAISTDPPEVLLKNGIELVVHATAAEALVELSTETPSLVIAPTDMSGNDPLEFISAVRAWGEIPVVVGLGRSPDAVSIAAQAVARGARGLIQLPFSHAELATVMRRSGVSPVELVPVLSVGMLRLNPQAHQVTVGGRAIDVTPRELFVLSHLMRQAPRVVSPDELIAVFGDSPRPSLAGIRVIIGRIRRKLNGQAPQSTILETVRGIGYRIAA